MPDNFKPVSPSQFSFVNEFQAGILKLILALPSGTGVFAPTCLVHCLSGQNSFHTLQAAGTSLAASLAAWYFNMEGVMAVSSCTGWACINACGVDLYNSLPCNIGTSQCSALTLASEPGATTSTDTSGEAEAAEVPALMAQVLAIKPLAAGGRPAPSAPTARPPVTSLLFRGEGAPPSMAMAASGARASSSKEEESHRKTGVHLLLAALVLIAAVVGFLVLRGRRAAARLDRHRYHPIGDPEGLPLRRVPVRWTPWGCRAWAASTRRSTALSP